MRIEFKLEQEKQFEVWKGSKYWYERGVWHRLNGPAVENRGGYKGWYEYGLFIRSKK